MTGVRVLDHRLDRYPPHTRKSERSEPSGMSAQDKLTGELPDYLNDQVRQGKLAANDANGVLTAIADSTQRKRIR